MTPKPDGWAAFGFRSQSNLQPGDGNAGRENWGKGGGEPRQDSQENQKENRKGRWGAGRRAALGVKGEDGA